MYTNVQRHNCSFDKLLLTQGSFLEKKSTTNFKWKGTLKYRGSELQDWCFFSVDTMSPLPLWFPLS